MSIVLRLLTVAAIILLTPIAALAVDWCFNSAGLTPIAQNSLSVPAQPVP